MISATGNWNKFLLFIGVAVCLLAELGEARYIRAAILREKRPDGESIPNFLFRMYDEVGREKFQQTWKAFNNRNPDQQDAFLMEDLSEQELQQLGSDFESFALALTADPHLMELYANFERNLSIISFMEMDKKLEGHHSWWARIKKFLYRKLHKLAQEMIIQEEAERSMAPQLPL